MVRDPRRGAQSRGAGGVGGLAGERGGGSEGFSALAYGGADAAAEFWHLEINRRAIEGAPGDVGEMTGDRRSSPLCTAPGSSQRAVRLVLLVSDL